MEKMKEKGIYMIKNLKNNKVIVGHTQRQFKKRWQEYLWNLRKGIYRNKHLQNSWNKYKEENFKFLILELIY